MNFRQEFPNWRIESSHDTYDEAPLLAEVDVLVVGGGAAGVAAATMSAEAGHSTLLVEKYGFCGGAAVAGMSATICGMYLARDSGPAKQIVFGFTERFRKVLHSRGGLTEPQIYGKTWTVTHDPLKWRETADELLRGARVRVIYHVSVTGVIKRGDDLQGVVLESNAGRSVVRAKRIIDCSGDATVVARAGYRTRFGDDGKIQNPTMFFRLGNVDMPAYNAWWGEDTICPPKLSEAILKANAEKRYHLPRHKIWLFPSTRPGEVMVNATRLTARDGRMLNVIDPEDFTQAEILGREQVREYAAFLAEEVPGCADSFVVDTGVEAGIRQTRSIAGVKTLTNDDVVACRKRDDGIARVPWPIELHSGETPKLHWLIDDWYDVPYQTLIPKEGENLIVAGRCLSAEHEALASARVTAQCFEYGHAAAMAVDISLKENLPLRSIPGQRVAEAMKSNGSEL